MLLRSIFVLVFCAALGAQETVTLAVKPTPCFVEHRQVTQVTMRSPAHLSESERAVLWRSPQKSPQNSFLWVIFNDLRCRPCVPSQCKYVIVQP